MRSIKQVVAIVVVLAMVLSALGLALALVLGGLLKLAYGGRKPS